jgi:CRP-like cAMP-binding protein
MYSFVLHEFKRNQVIYNQGDKAKMVYILHRGELEISRVKKSRGSDKKDAN